MNDNVISGALNSVSDRQIRKTDIELLLNSSKSSASKTRKIAFMAICAAALLGLSITAGAAAVNAFTQKKGYNKTYKQPTITFLSANTDSCPEVIEQIYSPTVLPDGVDQSHGGLNQKKTFYTMTYYKDPNNMLDDPFLMYGTVRFTQYTKKEFSATFIVPSYVKISETEVNGCPAYLVVEEHYYGTENALIWDNGDYIMQLGCGIPFDELMHIAESVKINNEFNGGNLS